MPVVRFELANPANSEDSADLKSVEWREKIVGSIVAAIESYFGSVSSRL